MSKAAAREPFTVNGCPRASFPCSPIQDLARATNAHSRARVRRITLGCFFSKGRASEEA